MVPKKKRKKLLTHFTSACTNLLQERKRDREGEGESSVETSFREATCTNDNTSGRREEAAGKGASSPCFKAEYHLRRPKLLKAIGVLPPLSPPPPPPPAPSPTGGNARFAKLS